MPSKLAKDFESFADLATAYAVGQDYRIVAARRPLSSTAIVAPHGGGIEAFTSDIARGIAGDDYGLYVFEGLLRAGNFAALHLSSERFDEPECLQMLGECDRVISVHGCGAPGEIVLVGGRDDALRDAVSTALRAAGIACDDAPAGLAGALPRNICNRGRTGRGVQLEVSMELRRSRQRTALIRAVRSALQG
jgi:phage replication-related protein YjqB (UPF0714/DUF867 family)